MSKTFAVLLEKELILSLLLQEKPTTLHCQGSQPPSSTSFWKELNFNPMWKQSLIVQPCHGIPSPWKRVNLPGGTTWVPQQGSIPLRSFAPSSWCNYLNFNIDFLPVFHPRHLCSLQSLSFPRQGSPFLSLIFSSSLFPLSRYKPQQYNESETPFFLDCHHVNQVIQISII